MPGVYRPRKDSFLLKEVVEEQPLAGRRVLDMGTGSGIIAATAAEQGAQVTAVDIDPAAVEHVRDRFSDTDSVTAVTSDLFETVEDVFDLIAFNPPYVPSTPEEQEAERSWAGGEDGRETVDRFIEAAPDFLTPEGTVLLVQSTRNDIGTTRAAFQAAGMDAAVVVREQLHFEELVVLAAEPTA
ncbi:MAG: HemK2/MTQ2 family protein methyltransferase [Candidatus Nanohaloarchaea archaeon]|nr:HemK2/MTQ2 family protein methyltransferase [Candidatus Nanohaloarchaea archaeon]